MLGALLIAITAAVYSPVRTHGFIDFDDPIYITHNSKVLEGITWGGLRWAFTTGYAENWHPLTWLSHMLDIELFGLQAGYHHVISVVLHIANSVLLLTVLHRMTGAARRSAVVAALFAIHPMHVESVAWIAERKDVLSTLLFMLTLLAYARYVRNRNRRRYVVVVTLFALGLMAKPMLVTLPFVLLLLDYWPLRRTVSAPGNEAVDHRGAAIVRSRWRVRWTLLLEKAPLILLSAVASIVTFMIQKRGGAVGDIARFPLLYRLANVPLAYVGYLGKSLLPVHLAVFYPYPKTFGVIAAVAAAIVLLGLSVMACRQARSYPYLPVGWFWFLGMLVPVIGIVQVGNQSMADRYTYVPLVGIFIIVTWGGADLATRFRRGSTVAFAAAVVAIFALAIMTRRQVGYWKSSLELWRHAIAVTGPNARAHTNFGNALGEQGDIDGAIREYQQALRIDSRLPEAHNNLGWYLDKAGRGDEALSRYEQAIRVDSSYTGARNNYGVALAKRGQIDAAIREFSASLAVDPAQPDAHYDLALLLSERGLVSDAIRHLQKALELNPGDAKSRAALAAIQSTSR